MSKAKTPRTVAGLKEGIIRTLKANREAGNIDWGTRRRVWKLNAVESLKLYLMLHGKNSKEAAQSVNGVLSQFPDKAAVRELKLYVALRGILLSLSGNYENDGDPQSILKWLTFNGVDAPIANDGLKGYEAALRVLDALRHSLEYSTVTHINELSSVGIIGWVIENPERLSDILRTRAETRETVLTAGMVRLHTEGVPSASLGTPSAAAAREYIHSCVGYGRSKVRASKAIDGLTDYEVVSLYQRLTGSDAMAGHKVLGEIFYNLRNEHSDEQRLQGYLKTYAVNHDAFHRIAKTYKQGGSPFEQIKWLEICEITPSSEKGFTGALAVTEKIIPQHSPSSACPRISLLARSGILQTAYERPNEIDRIVELYDQDPHRHIDTGLLDTHTALNDGWL